MTQHHVKATSFADPADVAAFKRCKAKGKSDQECFKVGDPAIGCWMDHTDADEPMCALPPEDMEEKWGSVNAAKHKQVLVIRSAKQVICKLADRMPHRNHIKNGAGIDLNPAACFHLGLTPPVSAQVIWMWA